MPLARTIAAKVNKQRHVQYPWTTASLSPDHRAHYLHPARALAENRGVEDIIRQRGAVPATVAILKGQPHVGLTDAQLELLAEAGPQARKCSRRDLAVAIAQVGRVVTT